jgi:hypothetical protein
VKHKTLVTLQVLCENCPRVLLQLRYNPDAISDIVTMQIFEAPPDPKYGDKPVLMVRDAATSVMHLVDNAAASPLA